MKISIITASLNSEKTIANAIESINSQTYSDIEHIIIDGKSSDRTLNIVENMKVVDTKIISDKDDGLYFAINKGIKLSSGNIIFLLHSDDILFDKNVVNDAVNKFIETDVDIVYGNILFVDKDDINKIKRVWIAGNFSRKKLIFGWHPPHTSLFVRREIFNQFGLYRTDLHIAADYDFMVRVMLNKKVRVYYLNRFVVKMREGGKSTSSIYSHLYSNYECQKAWVQYSGFINPLILFKPLIKIPQLFKKISTTS
ncbi:MAG: glycosyltransferase [Deltaproteobacteria bacterium]|nr:glycosyltransferase [Deltaproteobacteria bacterium]